MLQVLIGVVGVFGILVSVAGAVVSAFAIGRTRWAIVLLGGFAGEAVTGIFYRVLPSLYSYTGSGSWQVPYMIGGLLGLAAHVAVVVGVAGVLFEGTRRA